MLNILLKIIFKIKNKISLIRSDCFTKVSILLKKNIYINKGTFNQRTIFMGDGKVEIGENFSIGYRYGGGFRGRFSEIQVRDSNSIIKIGKNLATNNGIYICARKKIYIGNDVLIGSQVTIMDHNAHGINPTKRRTSHGTSSEIIIEDNVWIGNNVTILSGTKIGKNSIVGVGSVVKGIFPQNVIIQGNPAKIIKEIKI